MPVSLRTKKRGAAAQEQTSVAAGEQGDKIAVRRSARYTSEDIHRALFPKQAPPPRTVDEMKEGIRRHVRERWR